MESRALVVGYGNPYRRDDGVALYVVNELRRCGGSPSLAVDDTGEEDLGGSLDTLMLHQLLPELVPILQGYQTVVFVDAHTGSIADDVRVVRVQEEYGFQAVTHHMSPSMLLYLMQATSGQAPKGYLVSVRGDEFDFGLGLSTGCRGRADRAVREILSLLPEEAKLPQL